MPLSSIPSQETEGAEGMAMWSSAFLAGVALAPHPVRKKKEGREREEGRKEAESEGGKEKVLKWC